MPGMSDGVDIVNADSLRGVQRQLGGIECEVSVNLSMCLSAVGVVQVNCQLENESQDHLICNLVGVL